MIQSEKETSKLGKLEAFSLLDSCFGDVARLEERSIRRGGGEVESFRFRDGETEEEMSESFEVLACDRI